MKTKFCLSFLTLTSAITNTQTAQAQYQPTNRTPISDNTLGTVVNPDNFKITGGLNKGQTLFHSFTDFSIPANREANFIKPVEIRDIITRVTGNLFSDINGTINTNGANFFLINPNGIVFGTNAKLNVGKAFVGSTANSIDLVDSGSGVIRFGTNQNGDALLKVAPNVLFNVSSLTFGGGNEQISNFGTLQNSQPNQYIGLIGGNINMNGGQIIAPSGRVELGGLSAPGDVKFRTDLNNLSAQFPTNVARANVALTNKANVNVGGSGGGDIAITAQNIDILGASSLEGGIYHQTSPTTIAGDIKLNATEQVKLTDESIISNRVNAGDIGNGGGIEINTRNLSVTNQSKLSAETYGIGAAGNVRIMATENVSFDNSETFSTVGHTGIGKGGSIEINTYKLSLNNGARLSASTLGTGDAGNVKIIATGDISFDGKRDDFTSGAFSTVENNGIGNAGIIEINTRNLTVSNGAGLFVDTKGKGDAGNIKITATEDISFDGKNNGFSSSAISGLGENVFGKGGGIEINTRNLSITNGAQLSTSTRGKGDAGNVKITATENISFDGNKDNRPSAVFTLVDKGAAGKGGTIEITTRNLSVTNGAGLYTNTQGKGDAGNVKIIATENISFDGSKDDNVSTVFSKVEQIGVGKGGTIEINTRNLSVTNGAELSTSTLGNGDAGNIKITAIEDVSFDGNQDGIGSAAASKVEQTGVGKGGGIEIKTRNLFITNGAELAVSNLGTGSGGNIILESKTINLNNGSISSASASDTGGSINLISTDYLLLNHNSLISTNSGSDSQNGNGGNITINSPLIIAAPGNNDITANAYQGTGGQVNITSQGLFGIKYRLIASNSTNDITASSTFGQNGAVNINTPGIDPGRDTGELATAPTDDSNQISQVCSAKNRQNKLTVTGRGGLPPNANDPLTSDVIWQDARAVSSQPVATSTTTNPLKLAPPAVGLVFDGKGKVTLVAANTEGQPTRTNVVCPNNKS